MTSVVSTGDEEATFRYDLENDSVIWKNTDYKGSSASTQLHNDVFYMSDNWNKEHAAVVALSIEDESILGTYEHEGYERTHDIQVFDDYLLMYAREKDGDMDDSYLLNLDLSSGEFLWAEPVFRAEKAVETEDAFLYQMKEYSLEEEGFVAFDKQTGEQLYKLPGVTNLDEPIVNSSHIYLFNYDEDAISAYDFDGELVGTFDVPGTLVNPQLLLPHVTDDFVIYADEEAIIWMESDLSEERGRVEMGEDTALHRMIYTEDFLYAIVKDRESETFFIVIIDKDTGDIGEKFPIEYEYHGGKDIVHVYDDKFHFSIHESDEEGLNRVHYIHTGLKGESVHR